MDRLGEGGVGTRGEMDRLGKGEGAGRCVEGGGLVDMLRRGLVDWLSHTPVHCWCYEGSRVHLHRAAQTNCMSRHLVMI